VVTTNIYNRQKEIRFSLNSQTLEDVIKSILEYEGKDADFVDVHFISDKKMRDLHKKYFNDPTSTDCMSFPLDQAEEHPQVLGDIFICPKTAWDYVQKDTALFWEEITLYLIHATLHLLGYEDSTTQKRTIMKRKEKAILHSLIRKGKLVSGIL